MAARLISLLLFLIPLSLVSAQKSADPLDLIGISIDSVFELYGAPRSVYSVRGIEEWQDDVVFEYEGIDFYVFRNRVWQVSVKSAKGISVGDPKKAVLLVFGGRAREKNSYITIELDDGAFLREIRYNFDSGDRVSAIYLYRTDY